jgi:hypothetical protein
VGNSIFKLAGYLGYEDAADLKEFLLSTPVLQAMVKYERLHILTGVKWADAFVELRDSLQQSSYSEDKIDDKFGTSVDLQASFPEVGTEAERKKNPAKKSEHKINMVARLAAVVYQLHLQIEEYAILDDQGKLEGMDKARQAFKASFNITKDIPAIRDISALQFPNLGPFEEFGEDFMEPYNRVFQMLSLFQYLSTKSKLREFLVIENNRDPFEKKDVDDLYTPLFMRERIIDPQTIHTIREQEQARYPVKEFKYYWNPKLNHKDALRHLEDIEIHLGGRKGILRADPRLMEPWELRDSIRSQFRFQNFGLQLEAVSVKYVDDDGEPARLNLAQDDWEDILKVLVHNPAEDTTIEFGACLLEERMDLYEGNNVPSDIIDIMRVTEEGALEIRKQPEPEVQQAVEDDSAAVEETKVKTGATGFVRGIHTSGKRIRYETPLSRFPKGLEKERLQHYDGVDVTSAEGLQKWQLKATRELLGRNFKFGAQAEDGSESLVSDAIRGIAEGISTSAVGFPRNVSQVPHILTVD